MVTRFFDSMDKVMDDELGLGVINPRVTVLSGHDTTIALWLTNLGLGSNLDIPYGSALFLEVCQIMGSTGEQKFEIEVRSPLNSMYLFLCKINNNQPFDSLGLLQK